MSLSDTEKKDQVPAVVRHLPVRNIERVARSAGFSRITAKKYLVELVFAGTIKEVQCCNSLIFLIRSKAEMEHLFDVNAIGSHTNPSLKIPLDIFETSSGDA